MYAQFLQSQREAAYKTARICLDNAQREQNEEAKRLVYKFAVMYQEQAALEHQKLEGLNS